MEKIFPTIRASTFPRNPKIPVQGLTEELLGLKVEGETIMVEAWVVLDQVPHEE